MTTTNIYWTVGGNFRPKQHSTIAAAIATGNRWDRAISASNRNTNAGVDAYVVIQRGDQFEFRGLVSGRRIIGRDFGCGPSVAERIRHSIAVKA